MNWQLLLVAAIVACAVLYLGRQTWRTWRGRKAGCGGSCDCGSKSGGKNQVTVIHTEQLQLRPRQK